MQLFTFLPKLVLAVAMSLSALILGFVLGLVAVLNGGW